MGRREEREALLKALYSVDIFDDYKAESIRLFAGRNKWGLETLERTLAVVSKLADVDEHISRHLRNWTLSRVSIIDRSILRLAMYELIYEKSTPMKVIINEAVEIAKKYGTKDSFTFINAVLDATAKEIGRYA
ncbi:MAG: transcription antitermination factor NusB [Deltaproteobacteria bacterium]|nr:transcription antitermination factor NusB [Deltaproteobacteria bacterium]MCL5276493.1 transcription antitermination factor NusB [Deltaproteobacteria bacterium]